MAYGAIMVWMMPGGQNLHYAVILMPGIKIKTITAMVVFVTAIERKYKK